MSVDLPEPLGPMIAVNSPARMPSETSLSAVTLVEPEPYDFERFSTRAMISDLPLELSMFQACRGHPTSESAWSAHRVILEDELSEAILIGVDDKLNSVTETEFRQHSTDVSLNCRFTQELCFRDLRITESTSGQQEDLPLSSRESFE